MQNIQAIMVSCYEASGDVTAILREATSDKWEIVFPAGKQVQFAKACFESVCVDALSNPFPQWKELLQLSNLVWPPPAGTLREGKSDDMQLVASLIHLAYEISKLQRKGDGYKSVCGQALFDLLPPKNKLIVPSAGIQHEILNLVPNPFYMLGKLFKCEITFTDNVQTERFFYRPYNTAIVRVAQLSAVEDLNRRLNMDYQSILGKYD